MRVMSPYREVFMTRMKRVVMIAGLTVAAGAVGYAMGLVFAPASGAETRRRWTRRADDEWRTMSRSCERMFERASAYATHELEQRIKQIAGAARK